MLDTRPRKVHRDVASMCVMPIGATNTLLVRDTEQVVRRERSLEHGNKRGLLIALKFLHRFILNQC